MNTYDHSFYAGMNSTASPSASAVVPLVLDVVNIKNLVDVGCGNGSWLAVFKANGIDDIRGLDGAWIDESLLNIPTENFTRTDLEQPIRLDRKFDMAMSLEVAEHLSPERAAGFVEDLTLLSDVILFSAAIPGQGGTNHINEQWPDYWAKFFSDHGYRPVDFIRMAVWDHPDVMWFYKQNLLMFASERGLEAQPALAQKAKSSAAVPHSLVCREIYERTLRATMPGPGRWLKMGRKMVVRKLTGQQK
ncbi:MAG: class I SAM-dependent methyltransferase [Alphaproteobacteria bacterium]|nr:class I SAM-dependent methyltransferase [Alphaproteobacteria bacterium]